MFATDDTIAALATAAGRGALAIVRISGPAALDVARAVIADGPRLEPRHATLVRVASAGASPVSDRAVAVFYPRPHSYTGEDTVELSLHGGTAVSAAVLAAAVSAGARLAEPGEFTLRAFLRGKLDLVQAEAVADLIDAVTPIQARAAFDQLDGALTAEVRAIEEALFEVVARLEASLDFPDEGYHFAEPAEVAGQLTAVRDRIDGLLRRAERGRIVREGARVALVGAPNVGKSSLFNTLLHAARAIVTPVPGTTRDLVTERLELDGLVLTLVDTAGLRDSEDAVEREGVARTRDAAARADLLLVVLDGSRQLEDDERELLMTSADRARLVVLNKMDVPRAAGVDGEVRNAGAIDVSARTGDGIAALKTAMTRILTGPGTPGEVPLVTNVRHASLLTRAVASLSRSIDAQASSTASVPEEFLLSDLQEASAALQEIVGQRTTDDLLRHIFERFCIGK